MSFTEPNGDDECKSAPQLPAFASLTSRFAHSISVVAAAPGDAVNDASGHADIGVLARYAVFFGSDPELACSIVDLINTRAGDAVRANYAPCNGHFLVVKASRVVTDIGNANSFRTPCKRER